MLNKHHKMTYEPTNAELYSVIKQLCNKIENLETKINKLGENRETNIDKLRRRQGLHETPDVYSDWLSFIKVNNNHYDNLFTLHGGIIKTFNDIILEHIKASGVIPLYKHNKHLYVYLMVDGEPEWYLFDNDNLVKMVQEVWRKLLAFQLGVINDDKEDDEIKDQKRRIVLQIRKTLCDVKSNKAIISKWIREVI